MIVRLDDALMIRHLRSPYVRWRAESRPGTSSEMANGTTAAWSPHGLSIRGEWRAAADDWDRLGCPYERAEALSPGDVPAWKKLYRDSWRQEPPRPQIASARTCAVQA